MKTKKIELTDEQLKEIEDLLEDIPNDKGYIVIAQLRVKDYVKGWESTHIKAGILTGQNAEVCSKSVNFHIQVEKDKRKQLEIE